MLNYSPGHFLPSQTLLSSLILLFQYFRTKTASPILLPDNSPGVCWEVTVSQAYHRNQLVKIFTAIIPSVEMVWERLNNQLLQLTPKPMLNKGYTMSTPGSKVCVWKQHVSAKEWVWWVDLASRRERGKYWGNRDSCSIQLKRTKAGFEGLSNQTPAFLFLTLS